MQKYRATIRFGNAHDVPEISDLEKRVWESRGVAPVDEATLRIWLATHSRGFLVGEYEGRIRGYAYFEHLSYDINTLTADWPPAHAPMTKRHHDTSGNAMYGISAAADLAGLGSQLFLRILELGGQDKKTHLATLIRMQGLARFLAKVRDEFPTAHQYTDMELATWYAMRCVSQEGGSVTESLADNSPPVFFPARIQKDPVLTYPTRVAHMTLHAVVPSSFTDAESASLLALATFPALRTE